MTTASPAVGGIDRARSADGLVGIEEGAAPKLQLLRGRDSLQDQPVALLGELLHGLPSAGERCAHAADPDRRRAAPKYTVTVSATTALERMSPSRTATMTAMFDTSETEEPTIPLTTWSIDIETVRRVSRGVAVEPREVRGAGVAEEQSRETRFAWASLVAPTVSQSPNDRKPAAEHEQAGGDEQQDQRLVVALVARSACPCPRIAAVIPDCGSFASSVVSA